VISFPRVALIAAFAIDATPMPIYEIGRGYIACPTTISIFRQSNLSWRKDKPAGAALP
jgi:hypothetical protein